MTDQETRTIVCTTDLSEASRCALNTAVELAASLGAAHVHVLHVREHAERIETIEALVERDEAREQALKREVADEVLRVKAAHKDLAEIEVVTAIRFGKAYKEILRYAAEVRAEFIVVGTHGRTGLGRAVLGSVAERVARHAPCNVVVAKSPEVRAHLAEALRHDVPQ
ncbi:MAG: universal stress protein [Polyangiaceae bacterium]